MKKRLTFLFAAILVAASLWAQEFQSGDLKYKIISSGNEGNAVEVVKGDNYKDLTEVVVPATVEYDNVKYSVISIGDYAFNECQGLTSISIPESVTSIKSCAFWNCYSLPSITIPESVMTIEFCAFYGCHNIETIVIPENVTNIGTSLFYDCINLASITVNAITPPTAQNGLSWPDGIPVFVPEEAVEAYKSAEYWKDLNILAIGTPIPVAVGTEFEYDGLYYRVKEDYTLEIFKNWGYDYGSPTSVIIPENVTYKDYTYSVTSLSFSVFNDWKDLSSVTIPNSITSIGGGAFSGCANLESITIPESVTAIDESAFSGCSKLNSIIIPKNVTSIGERVFENCSNLESITVESGNTVYDSRDNCNAIIVTESKELIQGCINTVIPNSVISIGADAFCGSGITSITIPKSVTSIGESICWYCPKLESIIVESGNTVYDSRDNCNAIIVTESNELIQGCSNTVIPNGVTSIGDGAFSGISITSVTIPNSVTDIGLNAFNGAALTEVTIPNSVRFINSSAFRYSALTKITLPDNITYIPSFMLDGCSDLAEVTIPESVTWIGGSAFNGCSSLTSITIPKDVTSIGDYAFSRTGITSVIIPEGVTSIGHMAFMFCGSLKSVIIPSSVTDIGDQVFNLCPSLESIIISEGVTTIGFSMFSYCTSLTSITIPESVTSVKNGAFDCCNGLKTIYCLSEVPPATQEITWWGNDPFYSRDDVVYSSCKLYVPAGSIDAYKAADVWGRFENIVEMKDKLSFNIISEIENVVEVTQPSAGEYFGDIVIPEQIVYNDKTYTVVGVADDAFSGCSGITSVIIGSKEVTNESNVTNNPVAVKTRAAGTDGFIVGARAFKGCTNLQSVTLGDVVTGVGEEAFVGCTSLMSVACESANPPAASENTFEDNTYCDAVLTVPEAFSAVYQTTAPWSRFAKVTIGIGNVTVDNDAQPHKIFLNGKLIIRKNDKSYNLQGVEIK